MQGLKRTKEDVVAEFRAAEILEAACQVFARKGFAGASVDEIAEAAGLAKATVYNYFRSKQELYRKALHRGIAGLVEETRRNVEAAPTTAEKVRAFLATRIRYAEAHRDFVSVYHAEFGAVHPACLRKECKSLCRQQVQVLADVIREGVAEGAIRSGPADATAFLACEVTRALISRRLRGWSRGSLEEDIELVFDLIWKGLAVAGPGVAPCLVG